MIKLAELLGEKATFTSKYDDSPKLKGKQTELPDELQGKIINKEGIEDWQRFYEEGYRAGYGHAKAGVKPMYEGQDHEVAMAQASLKSIAKAAIELSQKIGGIERNIPGWIQDHIAKAENYIEQAAQGFHELKHDE